jgi:hypothetical protein
LAGWNKAVWNGLGVSLALAALGWFFTQTFEPSLQHQTHGFAAYYTGAWLLVHGRIDQLYDPALFNAAMQASGIAGISDIYDANAPILAVLTAPLGWWPPLTARAVWLWFNLGLLVAVTGCAARLFGKITLMSASLVAAALLLYGPLDENFRLGQMYLPFLLAALAMLLASGSSGRGVALALQLALKLYYGLFGLVAGLYRPKVALVGVGLLAGIAILLLPWLTPALWLDYLRLATGFNQRPYVGVTAYQTINGFFSHLFRYDADWNPAPVANLPALAGWLSIVTSLVLVAISGLAIWKSGQPFGKGWRLNPQNWQVSVALVFSLAPLLAPAAEEYHFTILALPLLIGARQWLATRPYRRSELAAGIVAMGLLAPAWPYKSWPSAGWAALVAYPRLYGSLILWGLLTKQILSASSAALSSHNYPRSAAL